VEIPAHNKTTKPSPNKDCMKNSLEWTPCILEQSPVLGKKQRYIVLYRVLYKIFIQINVEKILCMKVACTY